MQCGGITAERSPGKVFICAVFYGLSTLLGYLMSNPVIYIYIWFVSEYFAGNLSLNLLLELIYLHTVKWFQILLTLVILFINYQYLMILFYQVFSLMQIIFTQITDNNNPE